MPADQTPFRIVTSFLLIMIIGAWLVHAFFALQKETSDLVDPSPEQSEIFKA